MTLWHVGTFGMSKSLTQYARGISSICLHAIIACALTIPFIARPAAQQPDLAFTPPITVLEGKKFTGNMIRAGNTAGRSDDFIFANGTFHSRVCLEWGFKPGPYWVRLENGRLHFLARLTSEENGVMTYRGAVDGPRIDARVEWIRPRWYWTMERNFRFKGRSDKAAARGGN